MEYIILITMLAWIAASAASVLPGRERETGRLCALAAVFTAVSGVWAVLRRGGAFSDITAAVTQSMAAAAVCIAFCAAAALVFACAWNKAQGKGTHARRESSVEQSQQKR